MICALLALRPISHITKKTLSYLHSTKIEQMTKTMVIFKRGAIFLCCIRCDPIPPQTSVQRLAHTRNVTTCCSWDEQYYIVILQLYLLINLLNQRVNIMLRERVFNFTASLVGNVTVKRTVTQTFSTFVCFCHVDQGKDLLSQRYRKTKRIQLINPENLLLMILAHLLVVFCFVLGYSHMATYQSLFHVSTCNRPKVVN